MNPLSMTVATAPKIELKDGLRSSTFDDVYFNTDENLADARYVFLEGNDLVQRWNASAKEAVFVVAETGFGSGLNFLLLLKLWQEQKQKPEQLHYISCELHPFDKMQLTGIMAQFPELKAQSDLLMSHYPCAAANSIRTGFHRLQLMESVSLTLMVGDAASCYQQCHAQVDAWFLDGFDPKKNPQMWSEELLQQVRRLSQKGSTIATYTAASNIRRLIESKGFQVNKRKGYGKKREMITAIMLDDVVPDECKQNWSPIKSAGKHKEIVILGGGIAGLSVARACAFKGQSVTLIDKEEPMQGASGNPLGMVMPHLTAQSSPEALFYWRAFDFALRAYQTDSDAFQNIAIKEWCLNDKKSLWAKTLFNDSNLNKQRWPDELIQSIESGVLYTSAGVIDTQKLKKSWLRYTNKVIKTAVSGIKHNGDQWLLLDGDNKVIKSCEVLVVTAGIHSLKFSPFNKLPLVPKHGQISVIQCDGQLPFSQVQRHQGYAIPMSGNRCLLGATFDHMNEADWFNIPELAADHGQRNASKWDAFNHWKLPEHQTIFGKAGIRTTTPDHLPVCGSVVDGDSFEKDYADLHHGRHWQTYPEAKTFSNLYLMTGLGARGFTSAPLLGQMLADMISGSPLPIESDLCKVLHPNRFLYRQLKKKT